MTKPEHTQSFDRIGIVGRLDSDSVVQSVRRLTHLLGELNRACRIDLPLAEAIPGLNCDALDRPGLGQWADLIIVVGGDGTLLGAVGISGDTGDVDEQCAIAGIAALQFSEDK